MRAAWLVLTWIVAASALADATEDLVDLLSKIETYQANFEQVIIDRDGTELERSSGRMIVARGNRLRWETESPWAQLLVSDGQTLWQYDVDLEQVVTRAFDTRLQETPGLLLAGDPAAVRHQFTVLELPPPAQDVRLFRLSPHAEDGLFSHLEIAFAGDAPRTMALVDSFGQRTELTFRDGQRNVPVAPDQFSLQIPAGVDVLDNAR